MDAPNESNVELVAPSNPQLVEFLQRIAFPQNERVTRLTTASF
jgi:hypothetical protein